VLSRGDIDDSALARFRSKGQSYGVVMENYLDALEDKAKEFEVIRGQIAGQNSEQTVLLADKLRLEAENAARIAKALPRVEFESYLEGIQQSDASLYNQLIQEHSLEAETLRLAMEARAASDERQRDLIIGTLRQKLEEAFELKQQNREQEIQQLTEKLSELRQRIKERSDARDRIIEARLKELLGESSW